MLELQDNGAHNINLVTPTHFAPSIKEAVILAKDGGLTLPIVYNTSSYDTVETLRSLQDVVDIYLPDFKYFTSRSASALSSAKDYPTVAKEAISEMVRQKPVPIIEDGIMKSGVIVRILLLPSHVAEAKLVLKYLYDTYKDSIYISLMSQYTPIAHLPSPINRRITHSEYYDFVSYAQKLGIKNGFTQEFDSASESFIPSFDNSGV
jgi:putative pyruvate formate lyase activating enzyme